MPLDDERPGRGGARTGAGKHGRAVERAPVTRSKPARQQVRGALTPHDNNR